MVSIDGLRQGGEVFGGCTAEVEGCGAWSGPGIWRGGGRGGVAIGKVAVDAIGLAVRIFEVWHCRNMVNQD